MLRIGCCGFGMAQETYFSTFDAIEIQKTFYQPPKPGTAARWRQKAPQGFVFTLKAWQAITHYPSSPTYRRATLTDEEKRECGGFQDNEVVTGAWEKTLQIAGVLEAPLVVFQCPASFNPTEEHIENLRGFFGRIDRGRLRLGWEPRGEWSDEIIARLCRELDLVHVVDPFKSRQVHGEINYFRLHGRTGYRYRYTDTDLEELRRLVSAQDAYCMFNNVSMAEDGERFARMMRGRGAVDA